MNLKESIKRIIREETNIPLQVKRRINGDSLAELIHDIKSLIDSGYDESDAIYDTVRQFIASKQFKLNNDSEQSYWDSYIEVEEPLVDYLKSKLNIQESILREEVKSKKSKKVVCSKCGWSWKLSEGGHDPYTCHECGNVNSKSELTEKCWAGYTQKGMKTMFGKRYPNCVKKKKK